MEVEKEFDITIPDDAAAKLVTVGDAVKYIESYIFLLKENNMLKSKLGLGALFNLAELYIKNKEKRLYQKYVLSIETKKPIFSHCILKLV